LTDQYDNSVWIFNGGASIPAGVFTTRELAEKWIAENRLSGLLTRYPLDEGFYDWAVRQGLFKPTKEHQFTADFKGRFTCASSDHFHYEDGQNVG
jgi:hypothetical protein